MCDFFIFFFIEESRIFISVDRNALTGPCHRSKDADILLDRTEHEWIFEISRTFSENSKRIKLPQLNDRFLFSLISTFKTTTKMNLLVLRVPCTHRQIYIITELLSESFFGSSAKQLLNSRTAKVITSRSCSFNFDEIKKKNVLCPSSNERAATRPPRWPSDLSAKDKSFAKTRLWQKLLNNIRYFANNSSFQIHRNWRISPLSFFFLVVVVFSRIPGY